MKKSSWLVKAMCSLSVAAMCGCSIPFSSVQPPTETAPVAHRNRQLGCPQVSASDPSNSPIDASIKAGSAATVFKDVSLLAMTGAPVQNNMTVIVRGRMITAVGRDLRTPAGARVVHARGKWMMPGLVDAHMHLTNIRTIDEPLLAVALANGVTSEVELGGSGQPNPAERLRMRDGIAAGRLIGPTLYVAAPKINDAELSHAAGIRLVDEYRAEGYDLIKVYNRLSLPGYRGILLRASQTGIPVVGHVVRAVGLEGMGGNRHPAIF